MKKRLHINLITNNNKNEYNLLGEYDKDANTISYYESNTIRSKYVLDLNNKILIKDNIDYKITLIFDENRITANEIFLKKENKTLTISIKTLKMNIDSNLIYIKYKIVESNEVIEYKLEIE